MVQIQKIHKNGRNTSPKGSSEILIKQTIIT